MKCLDCGDREARKRERCSRCYQRKRREDPGWTVSQSQEHLDDQAALEGFKAWLDERRERLNNTMICVDTPGTVTILHLDAGLISRH